MILSPALSAFKGLDGVIRPSFSREFASEKTLNNGTGPTITFTRASSATYFDASGTLQTAAVDEPRFDHEVFTGVSRGLLIEESRTNIVLNSQASGSIVGTIGSGGALPTNWSSVVQSPLILQVVGSGTEIGMPYVDLRIYTINQLSTTTSVNILINGAQGYAAQNQQWTSSLYARIVSGTFVGQLRIGISGANAAGVPFFDNNIPFIESSSWRRYTRSGTLSDVGTTSAIATLSYFGANRLRPDFIIRVASPQLEQGAFSTSFIPTSGGVASRQADTAVVDSFNSFGGSVEGTILSEFRTVSTSGTRVIASLDDGTANQSIRLFTSGTDPRFAITNGNIPQVDIDAGTVASGTNYKLSGAYAPDDFAVSLNGAAVGTDTVGTAPVITHLRMGSGPNGDQFNGHIRKIAYYPKRLSNVLLRQLAA